jgi:biotin synthase
MDRLIDKLYREKQLSREEFTRLLDHWKDVDTASLFACARDVSARHYGRDVYLRGLIEFTNYCKNDCYYCGIRNGNRLAVRYRLSKAEIMDCCRAGYALGFRTFVLQGGEDPWFTDARMEGIVLAIRHTYPDCAITLSLGERSRESYTRLFRAGADRYLLRHETANANHYRKLHPPALSLNTRKRCLQDLKDIGFQIGCGFMVGSPGQTTECLVDDLLFIAALQPQMVGIGPFIPHKDTPFSAAAAGTMEQTLFLLALLRLMLPTVLLPATTALGTIHPEGRERGILAGANVVMPNLSPTGVRDKYLLYDGKICTGDEAAECRCCMQRRMEGIGYDIATGRGDCAGFPEKRPA